MSDAAWNVLPAGTSASLARDASALARVKALGASSSPSKVARAAQDFESILLTQWFEQAREAFVSMPGSEDEESDDLGAGQMMSLGMQSMASAVARSGGIGIARMLTRYLGAEGSQNPHPGDAEPQSNNVNIPPNQ